MANKFFQTKLRWRTYSLPLWAALVAFVGLVAIIFSFLIVNFATKNPTQPDKPGRLVTIYDEGKFKTILTEAETVQQALGEAEIYTDKSDRVEPSLDTQLLANSYNINIYRARPVVVKDGKTAKRIVTAAQSGLTIAKAAGISLDVADIVEIKRNPDILNGSGAIIEAEIARAKTVRLILYGQAMTLKTQAKTVAEFIQEKNLNVLDNDSVLPGRDVAITEGLEIKIWREGINTINIEESVPFKTEQVYDYNQFIGYSAVTTVGESGLRSITYEVEMRGGVEVSRKEIQNIIVKEPVDQVEVIGVKSRGGTTSASENERITWNYLRNQGFSRQQTAGIMGNLQQEHGFQTSGDGLAQWTGGRKAKLMAMSDPYSIFTQLDFLMWELNGSYVGVKNRLMNAGTIDQATIIFQNEFERCGACNQSARINYAYSIFGRY